MKSVSVKNYNLLRRWFHEKNNYSFFRAHSLNEHSCVRYGQARTFTALEWSTRHNWQDIAWKYTALVGHSAGSYRQLHGGLQRPAQKFWVVHMGKLRAQIIISLATIIYDVHILGDYSTTNTSALPPIGDIENDLVEHGFKRLITGGEKSQKLEQIEHEFDSAVRTGRGRINSKRAKLLLEAVKQFLPQVLNERFSDTLNKHGISIKEWFRMKRSLCLVLMISAMLTGSAYA